VELNEIFKELQELLVEHLGVETADVTMDANIIDDLGADSLDVVEIIMGIEDQFDIEVEDEDVEGLKTVRQLVNYISKEL